MEDKTLFIRLTFASLVLVFAGLIIGFTYFSASKLLLLLVVVSVGFFVYKRIDYSFYVIAFSTPLLVRAPELLGTSNFSIAEPIVYVILLVWMLKKAQTSDVSWKHTPLDLPLITFLFLTALSAAKPISQFMLPVYYFESFSQLYPIKVLVDTFSYTMLYFYVTNNFRKKYLTGIVTALTAGLAITSLVGLIQYSMYLADNPLKSLFVEYEPLTITSTLNHKNFFGMYLILLTPLTLYMAAFHGRPSKAALSGAGALAFSALIISHSRGALAGFAASMLVITGFTNRRVFIYFAASLLVFAGIAVNSQIFMGTSIAKRFTALDEDVEFRIDCMGKTLNTALASPMGVGAGTFREKGICYYGDKWWSMTFHHAHNLYLQIMVERGWLALAAFLYTLFAFFRIVYKTRIDDEYTQKVVWGISAGILAVLIHGLVDYPFYSQRIALMFMFLAGITVMAVSEDEAVYNPCFPARRG